MEGHVSTVTQGGMRFDLFGMGTSRLRVRAKRHFRVRSTQFWRDTGWKWSF